MKNHDPIEVNVPQPWQWIGRVVVVVGLLVSCVFVWQTFFVKEVPEDIILYNTIATLILYPLVFIFFIPVFIGRYPRWVVRIFGEKFFHKFINDCEVLVSERRINKANLTDHRSWALDQRIVWLVIIGALILLGGYYGNMYGK